MTWISHHMQQSVAISPSEADETYNSDFPLWGFKKSKKNNISLHTLVYLIRGIKIKIRPCGVPAGLGPYLQSLCRRWTAPGGTGGRWPSLWLGTCAWRGSGREPTTRAAAQVRVRDRIRCTLHMSSSRIYSTVTGSQQTAKTCQFAFIILLFKLQLWTGVFVSVDSLRDFLSHV